MKKVFKLLLIVVCVFPLIVKADMSAPYIKQIDAIVTKKGGISVKDVQGKTKHFDENAVIKITSVGNEVYMVDSKEGYYEISSDDAKYILPKTKEVKPGDDGVNKLSKQKEYEIMAQNISVYKGPSIIFDEVGTISKGTQVTAFYDFDTDEGSFSEWYYIQEENISGWININGMNNEHPVYEVNAKPLKVIFKKTVTINGTEVKENSIYKINYWADPFLSDVPVIKINNEYVVLDDFDTFDIIADSKKKQTLFKMYQFNFTLKKDIKLYTTYSFNEEITTIPANTELSSINLVYDYVGGDEDEITYLYVNYNNKLGWIKVKEKDILVKDNENEIEELVAPYIDPEGDDGEETTEATTQVIENNEKEDKKKKVNSKETIIIAVISAVSVAILALGSIVLLNKKNKKDTLKDINNELENIQSVENNNDIKEDK